MGDRSDVLAPAVVELLTDDDLDIRINAINVVGDMGPRARPYALQLVKLLGNANPTVRYCTACALGRVQNQEKEVVEALVKSLHDESISVRIMAAEALFKLSQYQFSVDVMIDCLPRCDSTADKLRAVRVIGSYELRAKRALQSLKTMMTDEEAALRIAAAEAVWRIDHDRAAIDVLKKETKVTDLSRFVAAQSLWLCVKDKDSLLMVIAATQDASPDVRFHAAMVLRGIGPGCAEAWSALSKLRFDNDWDVRRIASATNKAQP
jgi:HEAT repeat protein